MTGIPVADLNVSFREILATEFSSDAAFVTVKIDGKLLHRRLDGADVDRFMQRSMEACGVPPAESAAR